MGDRLAALLDQVGRRQPSDFLVVGHDAVAAHDGVIVAIDHHQADAERLEPLQQVRVAGGIDRREDDAVDLALAQHVDLGALLDGILVRAAQQQSVAARAGDRLEAGDDLDEERVHQVRDDDAERVGAAQGEAARDGVGLVAELGDLGEDAGAGGVADVVAVVEDLGDGRDGHAELAGDPLHRGASMPCPCLFAPRSGRRRLAL